MLATLRTFALVTVAAASAVSITAPAFAAGDAQSRTISYADLDLKSDAGVARLDKRVRAALGEVCGRPDTRDLAARAHAIECRRVAMETVRPNVELAVATARSDTQLALSTPLPRVDAR